MWSSVASQSIAQTQPIGSKPIIATPNSTIPKDTWNTETSSVQSYNGGSSNTMDNYKVDKKEPNYSEGQVEGTQVQVSNNYQSSDNLGFQSALNKVVIVTSSLD